MMNFPLSDPEMFAALAHHRHFPKAAAERGAPVSLLGQTIYGLEEDIGVQALDRTTKSIAPK
jgi:DNA-binding transcriptional LysR family regulator